MSDEPKPQHVVAGTILICGILALAFGGDVRRTETYQRMFNAEQLAKKQQVADERRFFICAYLRLFSSRLVGTNAHFLSIFILSLVSRFSRDMNTSLIFE